MEDIRPGILLEYNPVTQRRHRGEVFWQITFPMVLGGILLSILAFLAAQTTSDQASVWADISLIWLIIPVMMITLLSLVFVIASIYLNVRLMRLLPFYSRQVQEWFSKLTAQVSRLDNIVVEPVLRIHGWKASICMLTRNVRRK
jgi:hypothetical protein